jgi:hypothetical protein
MGGGATKGFLMKVFDCGFPPGTIGSGAAPPWLKAAILSRKALDLAAIGGGFFEEAGSAGAGFGAGGGSLRAGGGGACWLEAEGGERTSSASLLAVAGTLTGGGCGLLIE